eukprot:4754711-Prymnesium_polylepis.1
MSYVRTCRAAHVPLSSCSAIMKSIHHSSSSPAHMRPVVMSLACTPLRSSPLSSATVYFFVSSS